MKASRKYSNFVLILCLFIAQWHLLSVRTECDNWKKVIESDVYGYYGYLPALFIHRSFDYSIYQNVESKTPVLKGETEDPIKYYIGEAILLLPFFTVADLITQTFDFEARNGFTFYYQLSIAIASIFYLLLGLFALRNLLQRLGFEDVVSALVLFLLFAGTQLYHYALHEPGMSHVYSFSIISIVLNVIHLQSIQPNRTRWFILAFLAALVVFIRPINVLFLGSFIYLVKSREAAKQFVFMFLKAGFTTIAGCILIIACFFLLQSLAYYYQSGNWWVYSYGEEGFNWTNPQISNVLFSYRKGLFVYTPMLLVAFLGLWFMKKKFGGFSTTAWLSLMIIYLYITASWWYWAYGGSFGMRPFIDTYALWAIPLASIVQVLLNTRWWKFLFISICGFLTYLNLLQTYQYIHNILPYEHMNKERYWHIFLKTNHKYRYGIPAEPEDEIVPNSTLLIKDTVFSSDKPFIVNESENKLEFIGMPLKNLSPDYASITRLVVDVELNLETLKTNSSFVTALQENFDQPALFFQTKYLVTLVNEPQTWIKTRFKINFPPNYNPETHFTFYLYNKEPELIQARNLRIRFFRS